MRPFTPRPASSKGRPIRPFRRAKRDFERAYTEQALRQAQGNVSLAARMAGVDRKHFYEIMQRGGVDHTRFRQKPRRD